MIGSARRPNVNGSSQNRRLVPLVSLAYASRARRNVAAKAINASRIHLVEVVYVPRDGRAAASAGRRLRVPAMPALRNIKRGMRAMERQKSHIDKEIDDVNGVIAATRSDVELMHEQVSSLNDRVEALDSTIEDLRAILAEISINESPQAPIPDSNPNLGSLV